MMCVCERETTRCFSEKLVLFAFVSSNKTSAMLNAARNVFSSASEL